MSSSRWWWISTLLCCVAAGAHADAAGPAKPSVIVILTDDQGWADLGAQGAVADVRTPNLDELARQGVRFDRGYASAPQCVPSRVALLTGRYQQRAGIEDNTQRPLPLAEVTLAERLRGAGYVTGQVGKWHLEAGEGCLPAAHGFDEYFCGTGCSYLASHDLAGHPLPGAPVSVADPRPRVGVQTEAALSFLERHAAQPFFLYLAYAAPHAPLEAVEPHFARFPADLPLQRREALSMISAVDEGVGRIRASVRAHRIEDSTLVFFLSDNGAPLWEGAWDGSLNAPLVGEKGMLTDGGVRVPFVAAWPGVIPSGMVYAPAVSTLDVAATAVAAARLPDDPTLDGVDLVPFVTGRRSGAPHDALYWRWGTQSAVLAGRWKLIRIGDDRRYLFDVGSPEGETRDRRAGSPEVANDLERRLAAWSAGLTPPGLRGGHDPRHLALYDAHVEKKPGALRPKQKSAAGRGPRAGVVRGWAGNGATLWLRDGALVVTPDGQGAVPFLQRKGLELAAPLELRLRLRCPAGGRVGLGWRLAGQERFPPEQVATTDVPPSSEWQEVRVSSGVEGTISRVRVMLPRRGTVELQSIDLAPAARPAAERSPALRWDFSGLDDETAAGEEGAFRCRPGPS